MNKRTDPVLDAVLRNDISALQKALKDRSNPDLPDRGGRTPLSNAIIGENPEIVKLLLRAGVNVGTTDKQGFTPLHHAAQRHSVAIVCLLLTAGAAVDSKDFFGNTPLFRAVFESRGRGEVVKSLLDVGADQHVKNNSGVSPRDLAASIANFEVLSLLPEK